MSYDLNSLNVVLLCLFSVLIGISLGGLVVFVHSSRLHLSAGIDSDLLPLPLWRMVMKGKIVRCMWVLVPLALLLPYCKPGMYVDAGLVSFAFVGFWTFAISRDWYQLPKKAQELHDQALKLFGCQSFTARLSAIEEETIGGSPYKYHCVLTDLSGEKMLLYPTSDKDLAKMWGGANVTRESVFAAYR